MFPRTGLISSGPTPQLTNKGCCLIVNIVHKAIHYNLVLYINFFIIVLLLILPSTGGASGT